MSGIYLEYFIAKGWTSSAILILKTVVDPSISYMGISMFILLTCINGMIAQNVLAFIMHTYDIHPQESPGDYGLLVTFFTTIPCLICVPFFLHAGCIMKKIKKQNIVEGVEDKAGVQKREADYFKYSVN